MAELVDALGSGSSVLTDVEVQVLSRARCVPQELCDEEHVDSSFKAYPERDYGLPHIEEGFFFASVIRGLCNHPDFGAADNFVSPVTVNSTQI